MTTPFARIVFTGEAAAVGCQPAPVPRRGHGDTLLAAIRQMLAPSPARPGRTVPASRRGHGSRLAAIRQVMAGLEPPRVATLARGD